MDHDKSTEALRGRRSGLMVCRPCKVLRYRVMMVQHQQQDLTQQPSFWQVYGFGILASQLQVASFTVP